jgi:hypothetical protein
LWTAAQNGHLEAVKLLIEFGANIEVRGKNQQMDFTPEEIARENGKSQIANYLKKIASSPLHQPTTKKRKTIHEEVKVEKTMKEREIENEKEEEKRDPFLLQLEQLQEFLATAKEEHQQLLKAHENLAKKSKEVDELTEKYAEKEMENTSLQIELKRLKGENLEALTIKDAEELALKLRANLAQVEAAIESKKKREIESLKDKNMCVICLDSEKQVLVEPCNHLCLCCPCAETLQPLKTKTCPICRKSIEDFRIVFM